MNKKKGKYNVGVLVMILSTILILLWLGAAKFYDFEAKAIQGLVQNHPLMSWTYNVMNYRTVSNLIGIAEILTAIILIVGLFKKIFLKWAGALMIITFLFTTSFLITTPDVFSLKEGFLVTDFFILKDLVFLGLGITLLCDVDKSKLY